jgi:hypothetical protein
MNDAGIDTTPHAMMPLVQCISFHLPVPKQLLPKMLALLEYCHASDQKSTQWYFKLQDSIRNHYKTEGNCLFFGEAKKILSGEVDLNIEKVFPLLGTLEKAMNLQ